MLKHLICIGAAFVVTTANAAVISTDKDINGDHLKNIFGSSKSMQRLYEVGSYYENTLNKNKDCNSEVKITPTSIAIIKPIKYSEGEQYPESGSWATRFKVSRCGNSSVYNALFISEGIKIEPKAIALYPGESMTDPLLFMDSAKNAFLLIKASEEKILSECKEKENNIRLYDTKISTPIKDKSWTEEWQFNVCGQTRSVSVEFTPDDKGTKFVIKPLAK